MAIEHNQITGNVRYVPYHMCIKTTYSTNIKCIVLISNPDLLLLLLSHLTKIFLYICF